MRAMRRASLFLAMLARPWRAGGRVGRGRARRLDARGRRGGRVPLPARRRRRRARARSSRSTAISRRAVPGSPGPAALDRDQRLFIELGGSKWGQDGPGVLARRAAGSASGKATSTGTRSRTRPRPRALPRHRDGPGHVHPADAATAAQPTTSAPEPDEIASRWDVATCPSSSPRRLTSTSPPSTRGSGAGRSPLRHGDGEPGEQLLRDPEPIEQTVHDLRLKAVIAARAGRSSSATRFSAFRERPERRDRRQPLLRAQHDAGRPAAGVRLRRRRRCGHPHLRAHRARPRQLGPHLLDRGRRQPAVVADPDHR